MASRSHISSFALWIATMDLACLMTGSVIGLLVRMPKWHRSEVVFENLEGWVLLFAGVLLANYLAGGYKLQYTYSRFNLVVTWLFSLTFALLFLSLTSAAWLKLFWLRGVLLISLLSYSFISLSLKLLVYKILFRSDIFLHRTVILGTGERARELRRLLESEFVMPAHRVVAFLNLDGHAGQAARVLDDVAVINVTEDTLESTVRSLAVNLIVIGLEDVRAASMVYPVLKRLRFDGIEVVTPLSVHEIYSGRVPLELINEEYLMQASMESGLPVFRRFKAIYDKAVAVLACLVFAPVSLLIVLAMKLSAPFSPVFYTQRRVGRFGEEFVIYKFRTMRKGAEAETGAVWSEDNDPRITRVGRILRRFRLDEIPQFINVLRGEMSVVGPRPERPEMTAELTRKIPFYDERENMMPGLTGWAQIRYPYGNSVEDSARKLEFDLYYIKNLSFSLDLQIILSTLRIVILGKEREH